MGFNSGFKGLIYDPEYSMALTAPILGELQSLNSVLCVLPVSNLSKVDCKCPKEDKTSFIPLH